MNDNSSPYNHSNTATWEYLASQFCKYPRIGHLHFSDRKTLAIPPSSDELKTLSDYLANNRLRYQQFLRQKGRYPSYDIYACFQPFNECFKALFPFVSYLKKRIGESGKILNLWDRSGWTASMLGGWFPRHEIITVWEGDKDILGYKGFDHWMDAERRSNHTVVFADLDQPLPFEDDSISLVVGVDALHRFRQSSFLKELHRVAAQQAPIIFPHVHLTNSMPEPFFERGCTQLHGSDYQYFFDSVESLTGRKGYVLSEPAAFLWNDTTKEKASVLASAPGNTDYNACIAWLPQQEAPVELCPWRGHEQDDLEHYYLLENPLLYIHPVSHCIELKEAVWGFPIAEFLERHPVYKKRISNALGQPVEEVTRCMLYWARQGLTIGTLQKKLMLSQERLASLLVWLWEADLAQAVPVDNCGFRLQTLLGQQQYILEAEEQTLETFWTMACASYGNEVWCSSAGNEHITYEQAGELVSLVKRSLAATGLTKGDTLLLCGDLHAELLLTFWAAVSLGVIVVPLSSRQAALRIADYIQLINPAFAVVTPSLTPLIKDRSSFPFVVLDKPEEEGFLPEYSFEQWLSEHMEGPDVNTLVDKDDVAVVLWTTGTTGNPKGIPLSHSQLIRSGRVMTETYQWKKSDRYYALGGLETMSGLRHATVSVAEVGACCVLPEKAGSIYDHYQNIIRTETTILAANPTFFKQLTMVIASRRSNHLFSLRLSLCTGNVLPATVRNQWQELTGLHLYNYYGLTETSGICIGEPLESRPGEEGSIGVPLDCLVKVLDESGREVDPGVPGELCVYGAGVFNGYYHNPSATSNVLKDGWFHTGDLVVQSITGELKLAGRLQDMVKLPSGHRLDIQAVEEVLQKIQTITDFAVCPIQDLERESFAVFYVTDAGVDPNEVAGHVREKIESMIGLFALPAIIERVSKIPKGNHQKILRKELLDQYQQLLKNQ